MFLVKVKIQNSLFFEFLTTSIKIILNKLNMVGAPKDAINEMLQLDQNIYNVLLIKLIKANY